MIDMKFIPSKDNLPTHIYTEENSFKYKYTKDSELKESRIYYDAFLVDSDAVISSRDLCIVTPPYDSTEFVERCIRVKVVDDREVLYGEDGTICLLSCVGKIIGMNSKTFKNNDIPKINPDRIISYINKVPREWF